MKCYPYNYALPVYVLLIVMFKQVESIKCYQCFTTEDQGCYSHNLKKAYLKDCAISTSRGRPVCRVLSQVNFFTPEQDVTILRECAYIYKEPLSCEKSSFSTLHYSQSCECGQDECNGAICRSISRKTLILCGIFALIVK